jgi:hypothetical protein
MRAAGKVQKQEAVIVPVLPAAARRIGHSDKTRAAPETKNAADAAFFGMWRRGATSRES